MICANFIEARFLEKLSDDIPVRLELVIYSANIKFSMERFEAFIRTRGRGLDAMRKNVPGFDCRECRKMLSKLQVVGERLYFRRLYK